MKKTKAVQKKQTSARGSAIRALLGKNLQALLDNLGWGVLDLHRRTSFSTHFLAGILRGEGFFEIVGRRADDQVGRDAPRRVDGQVALAEMDAVGVHRQRDCGGGSYGR